jgi:uncharacterized coiled-coil protein SlyX
MEQRIIDLESKFTLLEDSYLRLSDEFAVQQQELRLVTQQVEYLRASLVNMQPSDINAGAEPPPPHY